MHFSQANGVYRVVRVTGPKHNLLGLRLAPRDEGGSVEVIDLETGRSPPRLAPEDVKTAVLRGLQRANDSFATHYRPLRIEFVGSDSPPAGAYEELAFALVAHLAGGGDWK
ncbi:hypothetical protein HPC49_48015 [Pyxidicoccus fallax]|uniref:Uncharacterized protein n=1 Tax=Pyxidicoccus fallax TaxID=394095 RepID=A0A848LTH2_9BACT|nr:hypothetical protein [Pyxidicoccus fallax]NMO21076.1 hypothetical protein [Pyxidicoccus fallax]NPC85918.1 hypothetical protein [Pyxidicoccus fallax]